MLAALPITGLTRMAMVRVGVLGRGQSAPVAHRRAGLPSVAMMVLGTTAPKVVWKFRGLREGSYHPGQDSPGACACARGP